MRNPTIALFLAVFCAYVCTGQMGTLTKGSVTSDSIELTTRLILPERPLKQKPPVLIIIHGSGNKGNWNTYQPFVRRFTDQGIAAVFFDKRGTGESCGDFLEVSVENSEEVFDMLGNDVAAVAQWTKQQAGIDTTRIGVLGFSEEGGWVAPLAVKKSPIITYAIMISGPFSSVGQEFLYNELTGEGKARPAIAMDSVYDKMWELEEGMGYDPYPHVAKLDSAPSLWLFGEKDTNMAVDFSQDRLKTMVAEYPEKRFHYKTYYNANHSLYDVDTKQRLPYGKYIRRWMLLELY